MQILKGIEMKISTIPFTTRHKIKALIRIFRALILREIDWMELKRYYFAMLHFERYMERLHSKQNILVI